MRLPIVETLDNPKGMVLLIDQKQNMDTKLIR